MNEKKIKVFAQVGGFVSVVYVTVPQDVWDKEVDVLEEEVRDDIANCEDDDEEAYDSASDGERNYYGGYIGPNDGRSHGYTSAHGEIAYHLVSCDYVAILEHLGVLEQLRDAIINDLIEKDTKHQYEHELQMLKGIKNCGQAMGYWEYDCLDGDTKQEDEEQVVEIWDRYPLELLDELAERVYGVPQKKTIVYLHGYGSSSQSNTAKYLAKKIYPATM